MIWVCICGGVVGFDPKDIEAMSMQIIESELGDTSHLSECEKIVVKRVIHTTADFDYYDNLFFSDNVVQIALEAIRNGAVIVTDTNMAKSGVNKAALARHGCTVECFMADSDVAEEAKRIGSTRAAASVDKMKQIITIKQ